jgi:hypothetical protein
MLVLILGQVQIYGSGVAQPQASWRNGGLYNDVTGVVRVNSDVAWGG